MQTGSRQCIDKNYKFMHVRQQKNRKLNMKEKNTEGAANV